MIHYYFLCPYHLPRKLQIYLEAGRLLITVQQQVFVFVEKVGKPFVNDLMMEIEKAMEETLPVLSTFKIFNPGNVNKSTAQKNQLRNTLPSHCGNPTTENSNKICNFTSSRAALRLIHVVFSLSLS